MALALDIIVVLIIVFTIAKAAMDGFISTVFDFLKFIVSALVAFALKGKIAGYFMSLEAFSGIKDKISTALTQLVSNVGESINSQDLISAVTANNPDAAKMLESLGTDAEQLGEWMKNAITTEGSTLVNSAAQNIQNIVDPALKIAVDVVAFLVLFFATLIILWFVQKILCKIFELPILKQFNKAGGIIIGVICAFFYVSLFASIATVLISNAGLFGVELPNDLIGQTFVFEFFTKINIFTYIGAMFGGIGNVGA